MAKLQKFREYHYEATQKVSENTRTLALSAIAIVWLLKTEVHGQFTISTALAEPLFFVVIALTLDFAQYLYRSIVWHLIFRCQEKKLAKNLITEDSELYVSAWWNAIAYVFFYTKTLFVILAYWKLLHYFLTITKIT